MANTNFTELDFAQLKENLIEFLRSQSVLKDYDFSGSGISTLIDLLVYNTQYNAFYANMVANEMFLDTAIYRNSVVSRAKMLSFTPVSKRSSVAYVNIVVNEQDTTKAYVNIPKGTEFNSLMDGVNYRFFTDGAYVAYNTNGVFIVNNVKLIEGKSLVYRFLVTSPVHPEQRFILPNPNIDTAQMKVTVEESENSDSKLIYTLAEDINPLTSASQVYFLQETDDNKYEIYFGDGIIGNPVDRGNVIVVEYVVTTGSASNGCTEFELISSIEGSTATITLVEAASGGSDEQSIESIKYLAPRNYQAQNRAVTVTDYQTLLLTDFPFIETVKVWGGEEELEPSYGKVFIAIKPRSGLTLSERTKESIISNIIKNRNLVGVEPVLVDPDYTKIMVNTAVKYDSRLTDLTIGEVKDIVTETISTFSTTELNKFENSFSYSHLVQEIDDSDDCIVSNLIDIKLKHTFSPNMAIAQQYILNFNNALETRWITLSSTPFLYGGYTCYFEDDGDGTVNIYRLSEGEKVITGANMGTIDYDTGQVILTQFVPTGFPTGYTNISIIVYPVSYDVVPSRNQILIIEDEDISVRVIDIVKA